MNQLVFYAGTAWFFCGLSFVMIFVLFNTVTTNGYKTHDDFPISVGFLIMWVLVFSLTFASGISTSSSIIDLYETLAIAG